MQFEDGQVFDALKPRGITCSLIVILSPQPVSQRYTVTVVGMAAPMMREMPEPIRTLDISSREED